MCSFIRILRRFVDSFDSMLRLLFQLIRVSVCARTPVYDVRCAFLAFASSALSGQSKTGICNDGKRKSMEHIANEPIAMVVGLALKQMIQYVYLKWKSHK